MKKILSLLACLPFVAAASEVGVSYASNVASMNYATCTSFSNGSCSAWTNTAILSSNAYEGISLSVGDVFQGLFRYDPMTPLTATYSDSAGGTNGVYLSAIKAFTLSSPLLNVLSTPATSTLDSVSIGNGYYGSDSFFSEQVFSDSQWFGIITIDMFDHSAQLYNDLSLPSSVDFADFDGSIFELAFVNLANGDQLQLNGLVQSLSTVPEPPSGLAALAGVLALTILVRRNRSSANALAAQAACHAS